MNDESYAEIASKLFNQKPDSEKLIYEILKGFMPTNMRTEAMSENLANELVEAKFLTITKEVVVVND